MPPCPQRVAVCVPYTCPYNCSAVDILFLLSFIPRLAAWVPRSPSRLANTPRARPRPPTEAALPNTSNAYPAPPSSPPSQAPATAPPSRRAQRASHLPPPPRLRGQVTGTRMERPRRKAQQRRQVLRREGLRRLHRYGSAPNPNSLNITDIRLTVPVLSDPALLPILSSPSSSSPPLIPHRHTSGVAYNNRPHLHINRILKHPRQPQNPTPNHPQQHSSPLSCLQA